MNPKLNFKRVTKLKTKGRLKKKVNGRMWNSVPCYINGVLTHTN